MKKIILSFIFLCSNCLAGEFSLNFEKEKLIKYKQEDWVNVAQTTQFELSVNKDSVSTKEKTPEIYSLVEFHNPEGVKIESLPTKIKKIYTYGIIECKNGIFHLLNSWYVDKNDEIIFAEINDFGTYDVEMLTKNTPRNDLFLMVCGR